MTSGARTPGPPRSRPYLARPPRTRQKPPEARSASDAGQTPARSPTARAPSAGAYGGARTDRHTSPHRVTRQALRARQRPERATNHQKPGPHQKPGRRQPEALPRARRPLARMVARAPTGVPDRNSVTRQALRARSRPDRGCGKSRKRQIAEAANRGSGKSRKRQIADPSEHNQKTNGNRYSVTTTQGFRTLGQIAY